MNLAVTLANLRRAGVRVECAGEKLVVSTSGEQIESELLSRVAQHKHGIAKHLMLASSSESTGRYPLLYSQESIWASFVIDPHNIAYNAMAAVELAGDIDLSRLQGALDRVVRKQDALRTRFGEEDGCPFQVFATNSEVRLERIELPNWTDVDIAHWLDQQGKRPIDLRHDCPWSLTAIIDQSSSDGRSRRVALALICHHIVMDLWSFYVFIELLAREYGDYAESLKEPVQVRFRDIAIAERAQQIRQDDRIAFWRRTLSETADVIDLCTTGARPRVQSFEGDSVSTHLSAEETKRVRDFAASINATPFHVVLAALQVVLARQAGTDRFCVGVASAGRNESELHEVIGDFANPIPVPCVWRPTMSSTEVVLQARDQMAQCMEHEMPFAALLRALDVGRDPSITPLFQALLTWHQAPRFTRLGAFTKHPLVKRPIGLPRQFGAFTDLIASAADDGEQIGFSMAFSRKVILRENALDMMQRWRDLATRMADHPTRRVLSLATEAADLAYSFVGSPIPADEPQLHPLQLICGRVQTQPHKDAVCADDRTLSYEELWELSGRILAILRRAGVHPGEKVAIALRRESILVASLLGVLRCGAAYIPVDAWQPKQRNHELLRQAGARAVLLDNSTVEHISLAASEIDTLKVVNLDRLDWEQEACAPAGFATEANSLAYVMYTSGTTGQPKGVAVGIRGVARLCQWAENVLESADFDGVLFSTNIGFDISIFEVFCTLAAGGTIVVAEKALNLHASRHVQRVRLLNTVPSAAEALLESGGLPSSLRVIILVGEPLHRDLVSRLLDAVPSVRLYNLYGPTEDTCFSTWAKVRRHTSRPAIGLPLPGTYARILTADLALVPPGGIGELYLGGAGLAFGYLGQPDVTASSFVPDPYGENEGRRIYRTGDLVRRNAGGELEFCGRLGRQIKLRGFRIELEEVELVLASHPAVAAAAAVLVKSTTGDRLVAFVVARRTGDLAPANLIAFARERLPAYMIPAECIVVDELPLTTSGKIDRKSLRVPEKDSPTGAAYANDLETELAAIWTEVLHVTNLDRRADFFSLGGHSLPAAQIASRISKRLRIEISVSSVLSHPSIAELGAYLLARSGIDEGLRDVEASARHTDEPLSLAQERIWITEELQGVSAVYSLPLRIDIAGPFDEEACQRAVLAVLEDNDCLRARFCKAGNQVLQGAYSPREIGVNTDPASVSRTLAEVEAEIDKEIHRPFDILRQPPSRIFLYRVLGGRHVLLLIFHHIVIDGWSIALLGRKLPDYYAWAQGRSNRPKPPGNRYAEFARWQRSHIEHPDQARGVAAWRQILTPLPEPARPLPDRVRSGPRTVRGSYVNFKLGNASASRLKEFAQQEQTTPFAVTLACFMTLLYRISRAEDLCVGTAIAARSSIESEDLLGFFVNLLTIRCRIDEEMSFAEVLRGVVRSYMRAMELQDVPFERVVQECDPVRDLTRTPLFQSIFTYYRDPLSELHLGEAVVKPRVLQTRTAKYDLFMQLTERDDGIEGIAEYSEDLYDPDTIRSVCDSFLVLLDTVIRSPSAAVGALCLCAPEQASNLLRLGDTARDPSSFEGDIASAFYASVARWPHIIAVQTHDASDGVTYLELARLSDRCAVGLQRMGVRKGDVVALIGEGSPRMATLILGIVKAGGVYLPIPTDMPVERLKYMLHHSHVRLVVPLDGEYSGEIQDVTVVTLAELSDSGGRHVTPQAPVRNAGDAAYIMYTSGSTGVPKGVVIPHSGVLRLVRNQHFASFEPERRFAWHSNAGFDASTLELWGPLLSGGTAVCIGRHVMLSAQHLRSAFEASHIDTIFVTTALFHTLVQSDPEIFSGLHTVLVGGEALLVSAANSVLRSRDAPRLVNCYGPTECTTFTTTYLIPGELPEGIDVPLGGPIGNTSVYILDPGGAPTPPSIPGELYVAGPGLAIGYHQSPERTAERFVLLSLGERGAVRAYRTGDLVSWRHDGVIRFHGRIDSQVKLRGFRVELPEIEAQLASVEDVSEVAVDVKRDPGGERRVVAYVVPKETKSSSTLCEGQFMEEWRELYADTYTRAPRDEGDDFAGWNSSYTSGRIPRVEMEDWVSRTVARLAALKPRRILEIGVGTGLLMSRLAAGSECYVAIDFAPEAVRISEKRAKAAGLKVQVHLLRAHEIGSLPFTAFDLVILNSVVQYFPNLRYLERVVGLAAKRIVDGGHIFFGDIRSLPLLESFHLSVERSRLGSNRVGTIGELRDRVWRRLESDKELVIAPEFFLTLAERWPRLGVPDLRPKDGAYSNEINKFRYDVIVPVGSREVVTDPDETFEWSTPELVRERLLKSDAEVIRITGVPNLLTWGDAEALRTVGELQANSPVDKLGELVVKPQADLLPIREVLSLVASGGFDVLPSWTAHDATGAYDLIGRRSGTPGRPVSPRRHPRTPSRISNDPSRNVLARMLEPGLRQRAERTLPSYMRPSHYVFVDQLPVSLNGKLDRARLPSPIWQVSMGRGPVRRPASACERAIAAVWSEVLGSDSPGVDDNFFRIGGHSLLAMRVISRLRERLSTSLSAAEFFGSPTIRGLATVIEHRVATPVGEAVRGDPATKRQVISLSQRRIWLLDRLEGGSTAYNATIAVRMRGQLDIGVLERSFRWTIERHDQLRTIFPEADGQPQAMTLPGSSVPFEVRPLSDAAEAWERLVRAEAERPFLLASEPPLRLTLVSDQQNEHVLVISLHHIVCDGWSLSILCNELSTAYEAFCAGRVPAIKSPLITYSEYALWQLDRLKRGDFDAGIGYWHRLLSGAPALLEMPIDYRRRNVRSNRGYSVPLEVPKELTLGLRSIGTGADATMFMVLLASVAILLQRFSGQSEVVIGTAVANRTRPEFEGVFGFFVNTLALRIDLREERSFLELVEQVRNLMIDAYEYQETPFERVVEALNPVRTLAYTPVFQVMLVLQNTPPKTLRLGNVQIVGVEQPIVASKFDLTWSLEEVDDRLEGIIEYAADLFDRISVTRLADSFKTLIAEIVRDPGIPISALKLVEPGGRSGRPMYTRDFREDNCLPSLFEHWVGISPEAIAVYDGGCKVTYAELNARANRLARRLRRLGVGRGSFVGLIANRSSAQVASILGILKCGAAYVPITADTPADRAHSIFQKIGICALVCERDLSGKFAAHERYSLLCELPDALVDGGESPADLRLNILATDVAYVVHTSGTTGSPKAVIASHGNVVRMLRAAESVLELRSGDVWSLFHSFTFDFHVWELWGALAYGSALVVVDSETARSTDRFLECLDRYGVTVLNQTPSAFLQLVRQQGVRNDMNVWKRMRFVLLDGEPLDYGKLGSWYEQKGASAVKLFHTYGITETTIHATYRLVNGEDAFEGQVNRCGVPFADLSVHVLDERMQEAPATVVGDIYIGGAGLAYGYWNDPAETASRFVPDLLSGLPGRRLYRTGDIGRFLADGELVVLGRSDQQVKIRGHRIELSEVETLVRSALDADRVAALTVEDGAGNAVLGVCVAVARHAIHIEPAAALRKLRAHLPPYMVPGRLVFVNTLPLTANGKVDRDALGTLLSNASRLVEGGLANETQRSLARIWQSLVKRHDIAAQDDFFDLGGHSLMMVELAMRIEDAFGIRLPISQLYANSGLSEQADLIQTRSGGETSSCEFVERIGGGACAEAAVLIHPIGGDTLCYAPLFEEFRKRDAARCMSLLAIQHPEVHLRNLAMPRSIEAMSALYRVALQREFAVSPKVLVGWSFGGVVAHNMAAQFEVDGARVSSIVMVDSPLPSSFSSKKLAELLRNMPKNVLRMEACIGWLRERSEFLALLHDSYGLGAVRKRLDTAAYENLVHLYATNAIALARHRWARIGARIIYVLAERAPEALSINVVQRELSELTTGTVSVQTWAADHKSIIDGSFAERLAKLIHEEFGSVVPPAEIDSQGQLSLSHRV